MSGSMTRTGVNRALAVVLSLVLMAYVGGKAQAKN